MNDRFADQGNSTILDNDTGLVWAKEDSWPVAQDWLTFQEALLFVDERNKKDYLGFHDWRIPAARSTSPPFLRLVVAMHPGACLLTSKPPFISPMYRVTHNNLIRIIRRGMSGWFDFIRMIKEKLKEEKERSEICFFVQF